MRSKRRASNWWICLKTLRIISLAWRHWTCIVPHWNFVQSPDPVCGSIFGLIHDADHTGLLNSQLTRNGSELLASSITSPLPNKIQLSWHGNCSGPLICRLANVHFCHSTACLLCLPTKQCCSGRWIRHHGWSDKWLEVSFVRYSSTALHNCTFPVKEGFNKSFHKSCCKFCWSKLCFP